MVEVRPFNAADLPAAHGLSAAMSWPHRREDWVSLQELGSGVVACDDAGAIVGTAMWWPWGQQAGTLGMVLVAPASQGLGIGRRLMAALLKQADGRSLMLNATVAGLGLYTRLGFRSVGYVRQHQGVFRGHAATERIRPGEPADRDRLLALDEAAFGAPRGPMLDRLLRDGDCLVIETAGDVSGFACRRVFGRGEMIGPVVAADEADAIALVAASLRPGFQRVDIPMRAEALAAWLTEAGLPPVDTVTTMIRGAWVRQDGTARKFGLVSQAFG
jgi:predicted N-acetyltransferase YhbS